MSTLDDFENSGDRKRRVSASSGGNVQGAMDPVLRSAFPFVYGAQYYRAPTPDRRHWSGDLAAMRDAGFNTVKFWAQWRWGHRGTQRYYFDDLDELMDLAAENDLSVTINIILDVAPDWLYTMYPDCRMIRADGQVIQPQTASCRQIGGYPGPCFNHPRAQDHRRDFVIELVNRYRGHPGLGMWDVWNEPETNLLLRTPRPDTLLCYCHNCQRDFVGWLQKKYSTIAGLNEVWGRCYDQWDAVEVPRQPETINDMIDWRLFHLECLTQEARRRIDAVKSLDRTHPTYLHPVPNTIKPFNSITCADDFQLARECDCFAGTINGGPSNFIQAVSSAQGRVCYNVESHLRAGRSGVYPKSLTRKDLANAFVPQIGQGVRGFLHWQYRAETLGSESPAWGLLETDGSIGVSHHGAREFWSAIQPIADRLMTAAAPVPEAAIFKSAVNEIYHWCIHGNCNQLRDSIDGFTTLLYEQNARTGYVSEQMVVDGLPPTIRLLILPMVWALDGKTADAIAAWIRRGGTLLCEGLTGSFNLDTGRHNTIIPGNGLAETLGLHEAGGTAVRHLSENELLSLTLSNGEAITGRHHYAEIAGDSLSSLANLPGHAPCIAQKQVGSGRVFYAGTEIGWQWQTNRAPGWRQLMEEVLKASDIEIQSGTVRVDAIQTTDGIALAITNSGEQPAEFVCDPSEPMVGLFGGQHLPAKKQLRVGIQPGQADLFVPTRWLQVKKTLVHRAGDIVADSAGAESAAVL